MPSQSRALLSGTLAKAEDLEGKQVESRGLELSGEKANAAPRDADGGSTDSATNGTTSDPPRFPRAASTALHSPEHETEQVASGRHQHEACDSVRLRQTHRRFASLVPD